ncbi:Protein of unknown function [Gryllus bimaculatus]|nr:Protein of unknown function [Gryllus bimaculatus]
MADDVGSIRERFLEDDVGDEYFEENSDCESKNNVEEKANNENSNFMMFLNAGAEDMTELKS